MGRGIVRVKPLTLLPLAMYSRRRFTYVFGINDGPRQSRRFTCRAHEDLYCC
jgi:hypothetical protein